jgi:hypothetical protein
LRVRGLVGAGTSEIASCTRIQVDKFKHTIATSSANMIYAQIRRGPHQCVAWGCPAKRRLRNQKLYSFGGKYIFFIVLPWSVPALAIGDLIAGLLPADEGFTGVLPADELLFVGLFEPSPDTHRVASSASSSILLKEDSPVPLDVDARYLTNHVHRHRHVHAATRVSTT